MVTRFSMGTVAQGTRHERASGRSFWAICAMALLVIASTGQSSASPASSITESAMDATAILQMERDADRADPREQCLLYTQVLHNLTEMAGRQIAQGEEDAAGVTLLRVDALAERIRQTSDGNARRIKVAEQLMEHTQRRLSDMLRVASSEQRAAMQATMQHVNSLHEHMLTLVFLH